MRIDILAKQIHGKARFRVPQTKFFSKMCCVCHKKNTAHEQVRVRNSSWYSICQDCKQQLAKATTPRIEITQ